MATQQQNEKLEKGLRTLHSIYGTWNETPISPIIQELGFNSYIKSVITKLGIIQDNTPASEKHKKHRGKVIGRKYKWNTKEYPKVNKELVETIREMSIDLSREYFKKKKNETVGDKIQAKINGKIDFSKVGKKIKDQVVEKNQLILPIEFALVLKRLIFSKETQEVEIIVESGERNLNHANFKFKIDFHLVIWINPDNLELWNAEGQLITTITHTNMRKLSIYRNEQPEGDHVILKIN